MPAGNASLRFVLEKSPVIPVIVLDDVDLAVPLAEALVAGGVPILEVTLRTPNAMAVIKAMMTVSGAIVGAGTVLSSDQAKASADLGCQFLVSPGSAPALLDAVEALATPLLPGAATPSEAMLGLERGYVFQKFFPAEAMGGVPVVKAFAAPLPQVSFCPTGGIDAEKAKSYLALPNVICVGGSWLMPAHAIESRDFGRIRALAKTASQLTR